MLYGIVCCAFSVFQQLGEARAGVPRLCKPCPLSNISLLCQLAPPKCTPEAVILATSTCAVMAGREPAVTLHRHHIDQRASVLTSVTRVQLRRPPHTPLHLEATSVAEAQPAHRHCGIRQPTPQCRFTRAVRRTGQAHMPLMPLIVDHPCCPVSCEPYSPEGPQRPVVLPCGHTVSYASLEAVRRPPQSLNAPSHTPRGPSTRPNPTASPTLRFLEPLIPQVSRTPDPLGTPIHTISIATSHKECSHDLRHLVALQRGNP